MAITWRWSLTSRLLDISRVDLTPREQERGYVPHAGTVDTRNYHMAFVQFWDHDCRWALNRRMTSAVHTLRIASHVLHVSA
jgi:hypothetical protein